MSDELNTQLKQVLDAASEQTSSARELTDEFKNKSDSISQTIQAAIAEMNTSASEATQGVSQQRAAIIDAVTATASSEADRAETAADAAMLNDYIYEDTATALASVPEGNYFSVPTDDDMVYLTLYRHTAGQVATVVKIYPSKLLLDSVINIVRDSNPIYMGQWSKIERTSSGYLLSNSRIYIATRRGVVYVAVQKDVLVPNGYCLHVDTNAEITDESGAHIPQLAALSTEDWYSEGKYPLFATSNDIYSSPLTTVPNINSLAGRLDGMTTNLDIGMRDARIARYSIMGGIKYAIGQDNNPANLVVGTSIIRIFEGSNSGLAPNRIASLDNVLIPQGQGLYVDMDDEPVNGYYEAKVTEVSLVSSGENGVNGFITGSRILLIGNYQNGYRSGVLWEKDLYYAGCGEVVIPSPGANVTFNPSTRTLSWSKDLYFQTQGGWRLRVNAGSVTFPDGGQLQCMYLSLKDVPNIDAIDPSVSIKSGRYYTGSDRFLADRGQIPLFWYTSSTEYGTCGGFPQPKIEGTVTIEDGSENTSPIIVQVHTPTLSIQRMDINVLDEGNINGRYIRYRFEKTVREDINSNVWHLQKAWVMSNDLSQYIKLALQGGEVETAIIESGKSDFVGGTAHGDIKTLEIDFHLDGTIIDPTVDGTYLGNTMRINEVSQGYEEGTNATVEWFKAYTTWEFTKDHGINLTQYSEFQRDAFISSFYNCFLTIARNEDSNKNATTAQYGAQSPKYETIDLISRTHDRSMITGVNRAIAWGGGISYEAEFIEGYHHQDPEHTEFSEGKNYMFFQNGTSSYNKIYFNQGFTEIREGAKIFNRYRYKINSSL